MRLTNYFKGIFTIFAGPAALAEICAVRMLLVQFMLMVLILGLACYEKTGIRLILNHPVHYPK